MTSRIEKDKVIFHPDPCCICGENEFRVAYRNLCSEDGASFCILECRSCKLAKIDPILDPDRLGQYYPADYYSYNEMNYGEQKQPGIYTRIAHLVRSITYQFQYMPKRGRALLPFFTKLRMFIISQMGGLRHGHRSFQLDGGRILDIGCGDGFFLKEVVGIGWETHGVEINRLAVEKARGNHLNVFYGDLKAAEYPTDFFDVIRLWSVIEHISKPLETLEEIRRILKQDGILIIQVPNYSSAAVRLMKERWSAWDVPRHLYHFSPETMALLLEKAGFFVFRTDICSVGTIPASIAAPSQPGFALRVAGIILDTFLDLLKRGDAIIVFARCK